jgi:hypothetical protein
MVGAMKKDATKAAAGRIGGLVKTAKGFAVNAKSLAMAIRASAITRKKNSIERRKMIKMARDSGAIWEENRNGIK